MTEAIDSDTTEAPPRDLEAALYHLTGAASVAAFMLEAIHENANAATSLSVQAGMSWLAGELGDSAENLAAIHEGRAPNWATMQEIDRVRGALERAKARGIAKAAARDAEMSIAQAVGLVIGSRVEAAK